MTSQETKINNIIEQQPEAKSRLQLAENLLDDRKDSLSAKVVENIYKPLDSWAVCATLESLGMRDEDAQQEYGASDLFELSEQIYHRCKKNYAQLAAPVASWSAPNNQEKIFSSFIKYYTRGLSFMLPILGQIVMLIFFRYSLWAYIEFTEIEATIVAIGTILSFIVSGGFIQAISRNVLYYLSSNDFILAKKSYLRLHKYHLLLVAVFAVGLFVLNFMFSFFQQHMLIYSLIYFSLLAELWVSFSFLYLIKHYLSVLFITLVAILPVYMVIENTNWGIFIAHFFGLLFANVLSWLYYMVWFHRKIKKLKNKDVKQLPERSILAYITSMYFIYGLYYFLFLFLDRIVSWSAFKNDIPEFIIWFRTPYELGMDWALLSLFLTIAFLEFTIERFSRTIIPTQQKLSGFLIDKFNSIYKKFYRQQLSLMLLFGIASIALAYFGVTYLKRFDHIEQVREFFSNRITYFTFFIASASYLAMAIGLFNGMFFLTLSRLNFAVRSILIGIIVNFFVGFMLSRWINYEYGVFGLLAGSIVYALVSFKYVKRFFNELDFYYYSAY